MFRDQDEGFRRDKTLSHDSGDNKDKKTNSWIKRKIHFPSVSNSPTNSKEDLLYCGRTASNDDVFTNTGSNKLYDFAHSPGTYRKTVNELEELRKRNPRLGSTSDYFSMTSSVCSEEDPYSSYCDKSMSNSLYLHKGDDDCRDNDDGDEDLISSYLNDIQIQTKQIDERNAELLKDFDSDVGDLSRSK